MAKAKGRARQRRRLSLSVRLSLLVLLAALIPLAAVVGINDYFARSTLIQQGTTALANDANAKATLIDTYLGERIADGQALANLPTAPAYLTCIDAQALPAEQAAALEAQANCADPQLGLTFYQGSNCRALNVGLSRGIINNVQDYKAWSLYDARGDWLLASGSNTCATSGSATVPKEDYAQVMRNKSWVSAVYYDAASKFAYVNIYTPIVPSAKSTTVLGFLRATLKLDHIWDIVAGDSGKTVNGAGSYAFITDENGIRIADTHTSDLFTSVMPLDASAAQLIASEQRYGNSNPVTVDSLPAVKQALTSSAPASSFQGSDTPGSSVPFQFARTRLTNVPWSYFALSPLATVTSVADNQIRVSLLSAAVIAILAILFGLIFGRGTTHPVRSSAAELEGAAASLKTLASRQQSSAGEQQWVVDACKTGLESVRYLSDAMNQAAKRIIDASNWFNDYWDRLNEDEARRTVAHLNELARYIDEAARRQQASSERMGKAINVTMQVSDQLVQGATAATQSAEQLEQVVRDLRHVVGGASPAPVLDDFEQRDALEPFEMRMLPAPVQSPLRNGNRSGRLEGPMQPMQPMQPAPRQLAGPGVSQTFDLPPRSSRPPQAPTGAWGQRQSGASQTFNGNYGNGNSNGNGDYGDDLGPNPWAPQGPGNAQGWNER
ncbi:MAG: methyl-accepting chemotaxis protein [Ktedonobacterales bacterium]